MHITFPRFPAISCTAIYTVMLLLFTLIITVLCAQFGYTNKRWLKSEFQIFRASPAPSWCKNQHWIFSSPLVNTPTLRETR